MTEKCDQFCQQEKDFKETVKIFQSLLEKYKISYNGYLEFRDRNTNEARKYSKDIEKTEIEIDNILDKLRSFHKNFKKNVKFNSGFLERQNIKIQSKNEVISNNTKIIEDKSNNVNSKKYILKNNDSLLNIRKSKMKNYKLLIFIFTSVLLVIMSYIYKKYI